MPVLKFCVNIKALPLGDCDSCNILTEKLKELGLSAETRVVRFFTKTDILGISTGQKIDIRDAAMNVVFSIVGGGDDTVTVDDKGASILSYGQSRRVSMGDLSKTIVEPLVRCGLVINQ